MRRKNSGIVIVSGHGRLAHEAMFGHEAGAACYHERVRGWGRRTMGVRRRKLGEGKERKGRKRREEGL